VGLLPSGRIIDLHDSNGPQKMLQMLPRPTSPKSQIDQAGLFRFAAGQQQQHARCGAPNLGSVCARKGQHGQHLVAAAKVVEASRYTLARSLHQRTLSKVIVAKEVVARSGCAARIY